MSPVGRPRGQKTDNATVTVRVTHHERLQYETRARSLDLSISEWARLVLRRDVGMWTGGEKTMKTTTISSKTDIETWVRDVRADVATLGDEYVTALVSEIQIGDHPAYGEDWAEYLELVNDEMCETVVRGLDALKGEEKRSR